MTGGDWMRDDRWRWGAALALGVAVNSAVALLARWFAQGVLGIDYEIHWAGTVPVISLVFAWVIQKAWKDALRRQPPAGTPPAPDASEE